MTRDAELVPAPLTPAAAAEAELVDVPGGYADGYPPAADEGRADTNPLLVIHSLLRGRYHWAVLLGLALGGVAAWVGYQMAEPQYRSAGLVQVKFNVQQLLTGENETLPGYGGYVDAQVATIRGQRVIELAMSRPEWKDLGRGSSTSAAEFIAALEVARPKNSELITVAFVDPDPQAAIVAVRAVIESYLELYNEGNDESGRRRAEKLEALEVQLNADLEVVKADIAKISSAYLTQDLKARHEFLLGELQKLEVERQRIRVEIAAARAVVEGAGGDATTHPADSEPVEVLADRDAKLQKYLEDREKLELTMAQLRQRLGERHEDIVDAKGMIKVLDGLIARRAELLRRSPALAIAPGIGGAGGGKSLAQLLAQEEHIAQMEREWRIQAQELNLKALEVGRLRDREQSLKVKLAEVKEGLDQLRVDAMNVGRVAVLSFGDRPLGVFKDQRKMLAAAGGMGGIGMGVGAMLLLGLADRRLRSSADASRAVSRSASSRLLGILPSLTDGLTDPEAVATAAHCVHHIRALMQIRRGGAGEQRTFMVTSPAAGDGKTSLTLGLGVSFAVSRSRTLLIDCDIIGGGLSARAGRFMRRAGGAAAEPARGLPDVLRGEPLAACAVATGIPNLFVLSLGAAAVHHAAELSPTTVARIIDAARREFDTVLIDTGPILGSLEASIVAGIVDGVVLTVSRGEQRPMAEQAVDYLHAAGARMTGIVFNRAHGTDVVSSSSVSVRSVARSSTRVVAPMEAGTRDRFGDLGPIACAVASSSSLVLAGTN